MRPFSGNSRSRQPRKALTAWSKPCERERERKGGPVSADRSNRLIAASALTMLFSATHIAEDVALRVYETRFHMPLMLFGLVVATAYALQVMGAALATRASRSGFRINLGLALAWLVAASLDHAWEVALIPTHEYRAGLTSKVVVVGLIGGSLWWFVESLIGLKTVRN